MVADALKVTVGVNVGEITICVDVVDVIEAVFMIMDV
jgi:hypothetical protein